MPKIIRIIEVFLRVAYNELDNAFYQRKTMFTGSMVALVTPFRNTIVDYEALKNLIDWQIANGTDGIVVCGSTGEGLFLSDDERQEIIKKSIEFAGKRVPIIAGCSAHSTQEALRLTQQSESLGADGVLVIVPYYVKPTQKGIMEHFRIVHENSNIPIIVYNNPGRCAVNANVDTIIQLSLMERVVALKDSDPNIARATLIRREAPHLSLLSGDDSTFAGYLAHGGSGCISVTANIVPDLVKSLVTSWINRDTYTFQKTNEKIAALSEILFVESNPIPAKYALSRMGFIEGGVRLPLLPASEQAAIKIESVLKSLQII